MTKRWSIRVLTERSETMTTVYRVHESYKKNGAGKFNSVKQAFPEGVELILYDAQNPGSSLVPLWSDSFTVELREKRKPIGDLMGLYPALFVSERARDALKDLLENNGEFLPVYCEKVPNIVAFHTTRLLDPLNKENCKFSYLGEGDSRRPVRVREYDFIGEKITSSIFRIKEDSGIFVTDEFVETVRQNELKGFGFRKLWNSEQGRVHSEISINNLFLSEEEDYNW